MSFIIVVENEKKQLLNNLSDAIKEVTFEFDFNQKASSFFSFDFFLVSTSVWW